MSDFTSSARHLVELIEDFSMAVSPSCRAPDRRFLAEAIYGMLRSRSVVLLRIGTAIDPRLSAHKMVERLGRHLSRMDVPALWERLRSKTSEMLPERRVYLVDDSDVAKEHGRKFESLGRVMDGSDPQKRIVKGYHLTSIVCLSAEERQPVLAFEHLHFSVERKYVSVNAILHGGMSDICSGIPEDSATTTAG